jgi:protein-S-isoprenylcysteine O-methyltransferase Ste14
VHPQVSTASPERAKMLVRLLIQTVISFAVMAVLLLGVAGDWGWPQGWTYMGEVVALSIASTVWLWFNDRALLEARLSSPFRKRDQRPKDLLIIALFVPVMLGWMVLIALDARRYMWTSTPLWAQIVGAVLIGAGMVLVWETYRANTFATTQVRVQAERAQTVVDSGPYLYVRHPMYAGMVLYLLGTPLMLSSLWGLAVIPLLFLLLALRTLGEEQVLKADLPGYAEYMTKTHWRIIPGIW